VEDETGAGEAAGSSQLGHAPVHVTLTRRVGSRAGIGCAATPRSICRRGCAAPAGRGATPARQTRRVATRRDLDVLRVSDLSVRVFDLKDEVLAGWPVDEPGCRAARDG
jgi:hypothetical protein